MLSKRDRKKLRNRSRRRQLSQQADAWVLDSGFLLKYDKGHQEIINLGLGAHKSGKPIWVTSPVVAEVLLDPSTQVALRGFLKYCLWTTHGQQTSELVAQLRRTATKALKRPISLADTSVVVIARALAERYPLVTIFTSDPKDIEDLINVAAHRERTAANTNKKAAPKALGSIGGLYT